MSLTLAYASLLITTTFQAQGEGILYLRRLYGFPGYPLSPPRALWSLLYLLWEVISLTDVNMSAERNIFSSVLETKQCQHCDQIVNVWLSLCLILNI